MKKRKVCFVITNFIHYSRNLLVLDALNRREDVDLTVVVGGTAALSRYVAHSVSLKEMLKRDGISKVYEIYFNFEGDNASVKAKTIGLGLLEFSTLFNNVKPDVVVLRGDRFEVFSAALAAAYMSVPIAHIEGGDRTGTVDESTRHAITKLSHLHFVTNKDAKLRLARMGEHPRTIFHVGSPEIEVARTFSRMPPVPVDLRSTGSGAAIDAAADFLIVMYHPVWGDFKSPDAMRTRVSTLIQAVHELRMPALWFWPNNDLGAELIVKELRRFNDSVHDHRIRFMRYVAPREFLSLLNRTRCLVGNSSAGIKECAFLGIPVVNLGLRQNGRLRARNVVDHDGTDASALAKVVRRQIKRGRYPAALDYFKPHTAQRIASAVATEPLRAQKIFFEARQKK